MTDRTTPAASPYPAYAPDDEHPAGPRMLLAHVPWFVFPLVVGLAQIFGTYGASRHAEGTPRPVDVLGWAVVVLGPVALFAARRFPVPVLAVTTLLVAVYISRGYTNGPIYLSYVCALVIAILHGYHLYAWCSVPVLFIAEYVVPSVFAGAAWPPLATFGTDLAWALACLAFAEGVNFRRQRVQAQTRARLERARRRSSDERLAIARELHDVLAHSISLINVQAGTALEVMDRRPEQARIALEAIKQTSKQALGEVRSVLDALRGPDTPPSAPLLPTAGLAQLDGLVARARATGLDVRVQRIGEAAELPAGVDLAALRIVQEALTNVVRHAGARSATVVLEYAPRTVRLRVQDDGHGYSAGLMGTDADGDAVAGEGGNGLPGMRERALALGGTFGAGNRPGGGFAVEAVLPLAGDRAAAGNRNGGDAGSGDGTAAR